MMKLFRYLGFNIGFAVCIYYGLYEGVEGAKNIAIFYAWFVFILSLFMFSDTVVEKIKETRPNPTVPRWFDVTIDIFLLFSIIYAGWVITSIAYVIHMLLTHARYDEMYGLDKEINKAP